MNTKTSVAPSMLWVAAEGGVSALLSLISLFVMAHIVGPVNVGVFALAFGMVTILNMLSEFLFQDALIQREDLTPAHENTAFTTSLLLGILSFGLLAAAAAPLSRLFAEPELAPVLTVTATSLLLSNLISIPTAQLRRHMQFRVLVIRTIVSRFVGTVLGPAMALLGFGVWSFVAQHLAAVIVSVVLILPSATAVPRLAFSWARFRELIAFALASGTTGMAILIQARLFPMLVGLYLGTAAVGFVNMAFRSAETMREMLADGIYRIGLSVFARKQSNPAALRWAVQQTARLVGLVVLPLFAGVFAVAQDFVPLVLGEAWLPTVPLIQLLAAASMVRFLVFHNEVAAVGLGRPGLVTIAAVFSLAVVVGGMVAVRPDNVTLAMVVWVAPQLCIVPFWVVAIHRLTGWSVWTQIRSTLPALCCALGMAAVVKALGMTVLADWPAGPKLATEIAAGALAYLALTLLFNRGVALRLIGLLRRTGETPGQVLPGQV